VALGLVLALVTGEGLARVRGGAGEVKAIDLEAPESAYERSRNPLLGYELKRDYRNAAPDLRRTFERTNAHGLRDRPRTHARPEGIERRVILLGDSVVEGHGVAEGETISSRLEQLLRDEATEVLNFGVSGYNTRAEVALLADRGLAFEPDVVVLVFVHNDFTDFNREALRLGASPRPAWANHLFERSHLFRLAALRLNLFQFQADLEPTAWNRRAVGEGNVTSGLGELARLADEHGFTTVVAVWPTFLDHGVIDTGGIDGNGRPAPSSDGRTPPPADEGQTLVIERIAASCGIPTARLSPYFRDEGGLNPRLEWTNGDRTHPSPAGCRRAAEGLADVLRRQTSGRLPAPQPGSAGAALALERALDLGGSGGGSARVLINDGVRHLASGRLDEAIVTLSAALAEDDGELAAHYNLAVAFTRKGEGERARRHFESALRIDPESGAVHAGLGMVLSTQGRLESAREHLERALLLRPDDADVAVNLGGVLARQERFEEAAALFRRALAAREEFPAARLNLARVLEELDRTAQARAHYLRALEHASTAAAAAAGLERLRDER
jgi:Tfp pilus assembly protein PilF/lysophospholipase L1-like esterase